MALVHRAQKARLRDELSAVRKARSAADIEAARAAVRSAVLARCASESWRCVAAYVPLRTEPGSRELLDALVAAGVRVLVPVLLADRDLDWAEWSGEPGVPVGVEAIRAADAVLVPALAVAPDGTRLGRGGGSYDRVLHRVPPGVAVVALLYCGEIVADLPRDEWDRPVSAVVTPDGWTDLGGARE